MVKSKAVDAIILTVVNLDCSHKLGNWSVYRLPVAVNSAYAIKIAYRVSDSGVRAPLKLDAFQVIFGLNSRFGFVHSHVRE